MDWPPLRVEARRCGAPGECLRACREGAPVEVAPEALVEMAELGIPEDCVVVVRTWESCSRGSTGSGGRRGSLSSSRR